MLPLTHPECSPRISATAAAAAFHRPSGWEWPQTARSAATRRRLINSHSAAELPGLSPVAVVHFRCSDVPFSQHPSYRLYPKGYYDFVAKTISGVAGVDRITLLHCFNHNAKLMHHREDERRQKCDEFAGLITGWLSAGTGYPVTRQCLPATDSWSTMLSAGAVVSTGGSFSFVPGVGNAAGGGAFVLPRLGNATCWAPPGAARPAQPAGWHVYEGSVDAFPPHTDFYTLDYNATAV